MKRFLSLLLATLIVACLCACEGNWETVNLKDPITIPADGVIQKSVIQQIKDENAIGVFVGNSGDIEYKWTVFARDITSVKEINLGMQLSETSEGDIKVVLTQTDSLGFSALLSISLSEKWEAQSATAYAGEKEIATVSVTGSDKTVLNLSLDGTVGTFVIRPDPPVEDETLPENPDDTTDEDKEPTDIENQSNENTEPTTPTRPDGKDQYLTDPVPEGKPNPVEPEDQEIDKGTVYTCTFSIECSTIQNNLDQLDPEKLEMVPSDGVILAKVTVTFYEGESVYDVLLRVCQENKIHMESEFTPIYNSAYVEGIHNLYEFDCGALSGWMYKVNGWYPNYGSSRYQLKDGDVVEWRYTCDLGNDIGGGYAVGG